MSHPVDGNALRATAKVLKKYFGNLTVDQTLSISLEIMEAQRTAMLPAQVPHISESVNAPRGVGGLSVDFDPNK